MVVSMGCFFSMFKPPTFREMTQFDGSYFPDGLVKNHQHKRTLENLTSEKLTFFLWIFVVGYNPT